MDAATIIFKRHGWYCTSSHNGFVFLSPEPLREDKNDFFQMQIIIPRTQAETKERIPEFEIVFRKYNEKKKNIESSPTATISYPPKKRKIFSTNHVVNCETKENFWFTRNGDDDSRYYYSTINYDLSIEFPIFANNNQYNDSNVIFDLSIKMMNNVHHHKYYFTIQQKPNHLVYESSIRGVFRNSSYWANCVAEKFSYTMSECLAKTEASKLYDNITKLYIKCCLESESQIESPIAKLVQDADALKNFSSIINNFDTLLLLGSGGGGGGGGGDNNNCLNYDKLILENTYFTIFRLEQIIPELKTEGRWRFTPKTILEKLDLYLKFNEFFEPQNSELLGKALVSKPIKINIEKIFSIINSNFPDYFLMTDEIRDEMIVLYSILKKYKQENEASSQDNDSGIAQQCLAMSSSIVNVALK